MKLERISENKIRCTLNKSDLADKQLLLNELAYGTDKARELFSEMMQKAQTELGFEAENIPLMVEAIPVSADCLILNITKVEDPEELDARFSSFTRNLELDEEEEGEYWSDIEEYIDGTTAILDNLRDFLHDGIHNIQEARETAGHTAEAGITKKAAGKSDSKTRKEAGQTADKEPTYHIYSFHELSEVSQIAELLETLYNGANSLYKNTKDNQYYLVLEGADTSASFSKACTILNEYAVQIKGTNATLCYMQEHYLPILKQNALQALAKL